jgi:hypothetical protein
MTRTLFNYLTHVDRTVATNTSAIRLSKYLCGLLASCD